MVIFDEGPNSVIV